MKIGINGMGRIGRAALKVIMDTPGLELVGVNDIVGPDVTAYLLKYDTVYGRYEKDVGHDDSSLTVAGHKIAYSMERDPSLLPWKELVPRALNYYYLCNKNYVKRISCSKPFKDDGPSISTIRS